MSKVDCKQVDIWAAALHTGDLDEASRLRLAEHLDACDACRGRTFGITAMVELLQEEPARLPRHRVNAMWQQVEAASSQPAPARRPERRRNLALLAAAACAAMVALGLAWYLAGSDASAPRRAPSPAPAAPLATAPPAAAPRAPSLSKPAPQETMPTTPASRRWEIRWVDGQATTGAGSLASGAVLDQGDRLQVGRRGRALLVGPSEVVVVDEKTSLDLVGGKAGASRVRLVRGRITVLTRKQQPGATADAEHVEVAVGALMVRPVGTVFSINWTGAGQPEIALAEGKLLVRSPHRTVTLEAPAKLTWGEEPERLSGAAGRDLVRRLTSANKHRARPKSRPRAAVKPPPAAPRPPSLRMELRTLEGLLLRGKAAQVRARAEALLARPGAMAQREAPALHALVAETHMRQGSYARARSSYLRTWKAFPRTLYGMDALYSAASMELERLGKPARAAAHLKTYLSSYRKGRQREGAYYLLHRALTAQGKSDAAAGVAARYRAEFPQGQYRVLFR